ncbi:hypothetical protein B0A50_05223 [Salinomyces thailandicus]|uniref:Transcriptional regulator n=1 Tax=Salinomyces thailandicus TaxID=706561 RepID=A0A4U0TY75_9PEZI|nr:hypothetical protein B0A50_05223 [Salinomyces thailandica]
MSDSELSSAANIPDDATVEQCVRRIVRDALKAGDEISINSARVEAEKQLDLVAGFFKADEKWKKRSKEIISAAVDEPPSPEAPKKSAPKPKPQRGSKRKSEDAEDETKRKTARGRKRAKKSVTPESDASASEDDEDEGPKARTKQNAKSVDAASGSEEDEEATAGTGSKTGDTSGLSEPPDEKASDEESSKPNGKATAAEDDESEMSEVFDEPPARKRRQKKSTSPSGSKAKKGAGKPARAGEELTADEEEIKRLQGWLLKCGIRKVWGKELKKFDTDKAKIKHLKSLLDDVGMTGRYSVEKAKQIKDQRELAAELEAATEFERTWGKKGDSEDRSQEEDEGKTRSRGLKPRGLVDFGDSGDEDSG